MKTSPSETVLFPWGRSAVLRKILVCAWLLMVCGGLRATEIAGLYRTDVTVQSRDDSARAEAFRRGLDQVLKRVVRTGDLASAGVRSLLANPENFVLQFEYIGGAVEGRPIILRVDFDANRIRDMLRKRGIEVWGSERPEILAWISIEDNQQSQIFSSELMPELDHTLRQLAEENGLPVTVPLGDLTDRQSLTPGDIAIGNWERIRQASIRYETQVILTGRLTRKPEGFEADWRLYPGPTDERWQGKSGDLRETLGSGIAGAYTRLAARYIPRKAETATLEFRVVGISSLEDVNRVTAYLGKLSPVAKVEWLAIGTDDALFRVRVRGGREALEQTLSLGSLLRPNAGDEQDFTGLTYRLVR
jgi:hypothetical protein